MINYRIGHSGQELILTKSVLGHFQKHRQIRYSQPEAGGQLFADFSTKTIEIVEATGPRSTDHRTPTSYAPDRKAEQKEIFSRYKNGLHYVGDWHTHPQEIPRPSILDKKNIADCVRKSHHSLNGFVLIVVGNMPPPSGAICDDSRWERVYCTKTYCLNWESLISPRNPQNILAIKLSSSR